MLHRTVPDSRNRDPGVMPFRASAQDALYDVSIDIRKAKVSAGMTISKLFVIKA